MQGSFWKIIAVVGVIGVGSLAILEVQHRLDESRIGNSTTTESELAALTAEATAAGEQTVNATLGDSEFEQLLATGSSDGEPQFDLTEPPASDAAQHAAAFYGAAEPPSTSPAPANLDTSVDVASASSQNPFAAFPESATTAASPSQGQPNNVQTAGHQTSAGENPFNTQLASGSVPQDTPTGEPFRRDTDTATDGGPSEFPLFDAAPSTDQRPAENPDTSAAKTEKPAAPAARRTPPDMQFFSGGDTAAPADQPSASTTTAPPDHRVAQLPDEPGLQLRPTPDDEIPGVPTEPFTVDEEEPAPARTAPPSGGSAPPEFPAFDELRNSPPATPSNYENENSRPGADERFPASEPPRTQPADSVPDSRSPFSDDGVPAPQDPGLAPAATDRGEPFLPADDSTNSNERRAPSGQSDEPALLPFAEDDVDTGRPEESFPSLAIPETEERRSPANDLPDRSREEFRDSGFDIERPRLDSIEDRRAPMITPRPRPDGVREFGPDSRSNDFNRENEFRTEPPAGRRSPDGSSNRQTTGEMRPSLVLKKSAPQKATVGTPLEYQIFVRNDGDATAYDVTVEDEVPSAATVNGTLPRSVIDRSTNRLVWEFDEIAPGETQEITVQVTPTGEGTLDGVATVRFKSRVKATTIITAPKLRMQMRGPDAVRIGEQVTYRYVIINEGTGVAQDVYLRTVLPPGGQLKHPGGKDLEYEIGTLKPDEQREVSLSVVAAEPGQVRTEAELTAAGGFKDQAAWRTEVIGSQLTIVRRGPKRRFVGRPGTFENIVSNETNVDAFDARIVEKIPEGMKFISASHSGRFDENNRTVTWQLNRIGAGEQEILQIRLMPLKAGTRESIVTVYENAGIQSDDYVSTTVVEDLHNVSADISQLDGPVAVGEVFGFTITIDNRGTADATDVELEVEVPEEIEVIGAGSQQVQAQLLEGNVVKFNVVIRIPPEQQQNFELKLRGVRPVRNGAVKASVKYAQNREPLVVSESVTVYEDL